MCLKQELEYATIMAFPFKSKTINLNELRISVRLF